MRLKNKTLSLMIAISMVFSMFGILQNTGANAVSAYDGLISLEFSDLDNSDNTFTIDLVCNNDAETELKIGAAGLALVFDDLSKVSPEPQGGSCVSTTVNGFADLGSDWLADSKRLEASVGNTTTEATIAANETKTLLSIKCKLIDTSVTYNEAGLSQYIKTDSSGSNGIGTEENKALIGGASQTEPSGDQIDLFFNWPKAKYTVTFKGDGVNIAPVTVEEGTSLGVKMPCNPTKTGYAFVGWEYNSGTGVTTFDNNTIVNGNIEVTAKWNPLLSIDLNGGKLEGEPELIPQAIDNKKTYYELLTSAGVSANPTRDFYKFIGWNTNETAASGLPIGEVCNEPKPATLYAIWEPITYKVECGCDENSSCNHISSGTTISIENTEGIDLGKVEKTGFFFGGWIRKTVKDTVNRLSNNLLTLIEHEIDDFNISYEEASRFTITVTPDFQAYNGTIELWLTTVDDNDSVIEKNRVYISNAMNYDTVYADVLTNVETAYSSAFNAQTPTREGYEFKGWGFVDANGEVIGDLSAVLLSDVTNLTDFYSKGIVFDSVTGKDGHVIRLTSCWKEYDDHRVESIESILSNEDIFDTNDVNLFKELVATLNKEAFNQDTNNVDFSLDNYSEDYLKEQFAEKLTPAIQNTEDLKVEEGLKWSVQVTPVESTDGKVGEVNISERLLSDKVLVKLYDVQLEDLLDPSNTIFKDADSDKIKVSMPIPAGYEDKIDKLFIIHYNEETEEIEYIRPTIQDGRLIGELDSFSPIGIAAQKDLSTTAGDDNVIGADNAEKVAAIKKALKTGDQTNIALALVMFALSAILLGYTLVTLKKSKGNKQND